MRTLYIECNMGAAGDMLMGALYELLEDKERFLKTMNSLGLPGVHVEAEAGKTCGIAGTHMRVTVHGEEEAACGHDHAHDHHHHHHHATPGHIGELIDTLHLPEEVKKEARAVYDRIARATLCLPEEVKKEARAVYDRIAQAEARAHGCPVGDVHFHEVGALDAVADVTGVCYCLYLLKPERIVVSPVHVGSGTIVVSPVHVGSGTVRCAHGIMPVPAPATANLLKGAPSYGGEIRGELCTPTGAALLTQFADAFGPMPVMTGAGVGIGIGTKEFPQANCVRVFLGESQESEGTGANGRITELICNLDDMTPEALSFACGRLLEAGALDVYTIPGTMKKGRPGHVLTVLCEEGNEEEMVRKIFRETATNGVRARRCEKYLRCGSRPLSDTASLIRNRSMKTWRRSPESRTCPGARCGMR